MKIAVIGDGGWGTAVATLLHSYGHEVAMWGKFPEYIKEALRKKENSRFLPGIKLPEKLIWSSDPAQVIDQADIYVLAIPSEFFKEVCWTFKGMIPQDALVVSLTKGLCESTHSRMSEVAREILGISRLAVISGPSHAEEVARGMPTVVVAASDDTAVAKQAQKLFNGSLFRVYTSTDPLGVEIGGAVKNVIAIAVGASDGLGFGDNTRAALITRGLAEITRFGIKLGAAPETFAGLGCLGDLIVTCTSRHSRNYLVGERLGQGESLAEILSSMRRMVAEGIRNAKAVHELSQEIGVEMPITNAVYAVCYLDMPARDAVQALMGRAMKAE